MNRWLLVYVSFSRMSGDDGDVGDVGDGIFVGVACVRGVPRASWAQLFRNDSFLLWRRQSPSLLPDTKSGYNRRLTPPPDSLT